MERGNIPGAHKMSHTHTKKKSDAYRFLTEL